MKTKITWIVVIAAIAALAAGMFFLPIHSPKPEAPQPVAVTPQVQDIPPPLAPVQEPEPPPSPQTPAERSLAAMLAQLEKLPPPAKIINNPDGSVTRIYKPELMWTAKIGHGYYDHLFAAIQDPELKTLGMSRDQAFKAQEIYNRAVTNRLNIERAVAEVKPISSNESIITIPEYSRGLEEALYTELKGVLGEEIANRIHTQLGPKIQLENSGFGGRFQEIRVTAGEGGWEVIHSVALNRYNTISTTESTLMPNDTSYYQALSTLFPPLPPKHR